MSRAITYKGWLQFGEYGYALDSHELMTVSRRATLGREAAVRSPRPASHFGTGFPSDLASLDMDEAAAVVLQRSSHLIGFMPESDLEAWLLPVVRFGYDFLLTPVEWEAI